MASEKQRFYWVTFLPSLPVFDGCQYGRPGTLAVVLFIAEIAGREHCVARYDTAHGTPHRDILGLKKGLLEKEWFFGLSNEEVFYNAIRDFQENGQEHIRFFTAN
jgi:hypothetical protein